MNIENALTILIEQANGDTGGSARCAMFLLSLWDGTAYKADLQDLLYNDQKVFSAMLTVFQVFYANNEQLDSYVTNKQMRPIIEVWGKQFRVKKEPGGNSP